MIKIGVDMDSVLAEIVEPLLRFSKATYGVGTKSADHVSYGLHEVWGVSPEKAMEIVYAFYRSDEFDSVLPVDGSVEGIDYLADKYELVVITSRPFWIEEKSQAWILKYFEGKFAKIVHTNQFSKDADQTKKSAVCKMEGISLMIEDSLEIASDCADNDIKTILLTMPWNRVESLHLNITRVAHWREIQKLL